MSEKSESDPERDEILTKLHDELRRMYRRSGEPSTRTIARLTHGAISHQTVNLVLRCSTLPRWGQLELIVEALGGDTNTFRELWIAVRDAEDQSRRRTGDSNSDSNHRTPIARAGEIDSQTERGSDPDDSSSQTKLSSSLIGDPVVERSVVSIESVRTSATVDLIERGLRDLVKGDSSARERLVVSDAPGVRALRTLAAFLTRTGDGDANESSADAINELLQREITLIEDRDGRAHPRYRAALQAAFLTPPLDVRYAGESLADRLEAARQAGAFDRKVSSAKNPPGMNTARNSWNQGVRRLAETLVDRFNAQQAVDEWFMRESEMQPVVVNELVATCFFAGKMIARRLTERWITAAEDGVQQFVVRAWSITNQDEPRRLEIRPVLNCSLGSVHKVDLGQGVLGQIAYISLPSVLSAGERSFFATEAAFFVPADQGYTDVRVDGHGIDELVIRLQFDANEQFPLRCWHFAHEERGFFVRQPEPQEQRYLPVSQCGFVEHRFTDCVAGANYGLAWTWA